MVASLSMTRLMAMCFIIIFHSFPISAKQTDIIKDDPRFCRFPGKSFGDLTTEEFVDLDFKKIECTRKALDNNVVSEQLTIPFINPLIPLNFPPGLRLFPMGDFAFLFPVMGNMGRNYKHFYLKGNEERVQRRLKEIDQQEVEELVEDYELLAKEIKDIESDIYAAEVIEKRNSMVKKSRNLFAQTNFPFKWEDAKNLSDSELWSYHSYKSVMVGPSISGNFITKESIDVFGHLGGAILGGNAVWHFDNKISVRKIIVPSGVDGHVVERLQIKFEGLNANGKGFSLGGSPFADNGTLGQLMVNTTYNALTYAFFGMASVYIVPIGYKQYSQNENAFTFILEFDTSDDLAKLAYEEAVRGNFSESENVMGKINLAGQPAVSKVFQGKVNKRTKNTEFRKGIPLLGTSTTTCIKEVSSFSQEYLGDLDESRKDYQGLSQDYSCTNKKGGLFVRPFVGKEVSKGGIKGVFMKFDPPVAEPEYKISNVLNQEGYVLFEASYEDTRINKNKFNKLFSRFKTLDSKIESAIEQLLESHRKGNFDVDFKMKYFLPMDLVLKFINKPLERCEECDNDIFNDLISVQEKLKSQVGATLDEEGLAKFFGEFNSLFKSKDSFHYLHQMFFNLKDDFSSIDYLISINSKKLGLSFPVVLMSDSLNKELENSLTSGFNTGKNPLAVEMVLKDPAFNERERIFTVNEVAGLGVPEKIDLFSGFFLGEDTALEVTCECQVRNERGNWEDPFKVSVVGLKSIDEANKLSDITEVKLSKACYDSANQYNSMVSTNKKVNFNYIKLNKMSCETKELPKITGSKQSKLKKKYKELQTIYQKYMDEKTSCGDKFLPFKKTPRWLRLTLSTLVAGFGWEVRGEGSGGRGRGGAATGLGSLFAVSFISANSCEAFKDGLIASMLLFVGENLGWGAFFDMGVHHNNPNYARLDETGKSVLFHDIPGMTVRGAWITALASGYLKAQGYDFKQETTGDIIGYVYFLTRSLSKLDGGHPDIIDDKFLNNVIDVLGIRRGQNDAINNGDPYRTHIELAEYVVGLIIGYELSRSLLDAP